MEGMSTPFSSRSVKIPNDDRLGWSSDRPRRDGAPARPANIATRCRVLSPADQLRYSPGSLVVIVSASASERDRFAKRLIEDRASLLSLEKVRGLIAGKVPEDEVEARAAQLLDAAVSKRLDAGETVVFTAETLSAEERDPIVRKASALRRPRHMILLEGGRDQVQEEDRAELNELRRALDAGELGEQGFQTVLRLGGDTIGELKRLRFRRPPRDDD